jgi:hypothetical protein
MSQVHFDEAQELGGGRLARKQENLDARPPVCLELLRPLIDLQVAPQDRPPALSYFRQPVFIQRTRSSFACSE